MALSFDERMELERTQHQNRIELKEIEHNYKQQDKEDNIALGVKGYLAHKALSTIFGGADVHSAGSLKQNAGVLQGVKEPVVILRRKKKFQPEEEDIAHSIGLPSNHYITINTIQGFTRIKAVHLEIDGATDEELNMIEQQLKKGVILEWL